jgi:hypothetical protein
MHLLPVTADTLPLVTASVALPLFSMEAFSTKSADEPESCVRGKKISKKKGGLENSHIPIALLLRVLIFSLCCTLLPDRR